MCEPTPIRNWLIAYPSAIVFSIATIIGAAIAHSSYTQMPLTAQIG